MFRLVSVFAIAGFLLLLPLAAAVGQTPQEPRPHGQSYPEWAAGWWAWALSQPVGASDLCEKGRQQHNVWFPDPAFGVIDPMLRCTVPAGTAVFSPAATTVYCAELTDPPERRTEEFIRAQVAHVRTHAHDLLVEVDGRAQRLTYEESTLFSVTLPADNVFGLPTGEVLEPCADAGYWVMVPPLSIGIHAIHVHGEIDDFSIDVRYVLTVAPR